MFDVKHVSITVPVSTELLDDTREAPGYWALIREGWAAAIRDQQWLEAMRPAQRFRVLRLRALIGRAVRDQREREREARICPCCGCDPDEHGDVW